MEATWEPKSHLANALNVLEDCLHHVNTEEQSTWTGGVVISVEYASEDLPQAGCICMGREELVLGSQPPLG